MITTETLHRRITKIEAIVPHLRSKIKESRNRLTWLLGQSNPPASNAAIRKAKVFEQSVYHRYRRALKRYEIAILASFPEDNDSFGSSK